MPRFFFDIDEGDVKSHDDEGIELVDVEQAVNQAMVTLPAIAREAPLGRETLTVRSSVRNEIGQVVFEATLNLQLRQFRPA